MHLCVFEVSLTRVVVQKAQGCPAIILWVLAGPARYGFLEEGQPEVLYLRLANLWWTRLGLRRRGSGSCPNPCIDSEEGLKVHERVKGEGMETPE